jgi:hypothetical protein
MNAEHLRLEEQRLGTKNWRRWGPYLSERQWGTVREDYSPEGDAWNDFTFDQAKSRAYRWGEDGLAGVCDERGRLCLALALWNGRDPILKERLFGLTNSQGNHGEDVKELYYYLDALPSHAYLKYLYKYPQRPFPYDRLVAESRRRGRLEPEFELLDTGVFDDDRYFDVTVEYAKVTPNDVMMLVTVTNRGPEAATLHLLPQVWFRNTWSWTPHVPRPRISLREDRTIVADHETLKTFYLVADPDTEALFCDNDTNLRRLYGRPVGGYFKDAFHDYVVGGRRDAVNPSLAGTKAALHYKLEIPPGGSSAVRVRLSRNDYERSLANFDGVFARRRREADEFYDEAQAGITNEDARRVHRQALAG